MVKHHGVALLILVKKATILCDFPHHRVIAFLLETWVCVLFRWKWKYRICKYGGIEAQNLNLCLRFSLIEVYLSVAVFFCMYKMSSFFAYDFLSLHNLRLKFWKSLPVLPWPSDGRLVTTILFSGPWCQKQN